MKGVNVNLDNFLENDFWTPPPFNFVHRSHQHKDILGHVAAAPGPLAFPNRGARPPTLAEPERSAKKFYEPNLTLKKRDHYSKVKRRGWGSKNRSLSLALGFFISTTENGVAGSNITF